MSEPDTSDALQERIDEATAAGDVGLANELYQKQIGNTDHYGDKAEAAAAEAGALAVLSDTKADDAPQASTGEVVVATSAAEDETATITGEQDFAGNPEHVAAALEAMSVWDVDENGQPSSDLVGELKAEWGSDMGRNLAFFRAFALAHPDIHEILVASGFGDHPAIIRVGAMLGRRYATKSGDPGQITTRKAKTAMTTETDTMNTAAIEAKIKGIHQEMEKASAENDFGEANRLYLIEQELYGRLPGGGEPLVGQSGRIS